MFKESLTGRRIIDKLCQEDGIDGYSLRNRSAKDLAEMIANALQDEGKGEYLQDFFRGNTAQEEISISLVPKKEPIKFEAGLVSELGDLGGPKFQNPKTDTYKIRTDLNYLLALLYSKIFPIFEDTIFTPANGIVHTYKFNNQPSTAHIATITSYRGIGLSLSQSHLYESIISSMTAISDKLINETLHGNFSDPRRESYNWDSFDGIEKIYGIQNQRSLEEYHEQYKWGYAYLGTPFPMILELPVGHNGALSRIFINFLMNGLVANAPS